AVGLVMVAAVLGGLAIGILTAENPVVTSPDPSQLEVKTPALATPAQKGAETATAEPSDQAEKSQQKNVERREPPPPSPITARFEQAERALAAEGILFLAHFDIAVLEEVENAILGMGDPNALPPYFSDPTDVLSALEAAGFDIGEAIDHLLVGLYASEAGEIGFAAMALGDIPQSTILDILSEGQEVSSGEISGTQGYFMTRRDPETCQLSQPIAIEMDSGHLLFGSPWAVEKLLARLQNESKADRDLTVWRDLRSGQVFSFTTLIRPEEIAAIAAKTNPMSGFILGPAQNDIPQIGALSGGLTLEALPFRADFHLTVDSESNAWAEEQAGKFREGKDALIRDYGNDLPSLSALAEVLSLTSQNDRLTFEVRLDEEVLKEFAALPAEVIKLTFGGLGAQMEGAFQSGEIQESLLEDGEVVPYLRTANAAALPAFDPQANVFLVPDAVAGPFGIMLRATRLSDQQDENGSPLLELVLEAESAAIPNAPADTFHQEKSRPGAALRVSGIKNEEGEDLLRQENCGPDLNHDATALQFQEHSSYRNDGWVKENKARGEKTLRLHEGAQIDDIAQIEGSVNLRLAVETSETVLDAPLEGQVIEAHGLRILFEKSASDSVKYVVSGETSRLLSLRALNKDNRYLSNSGTSGGEELFGSAKHVDRRFQGRIAKVEIVIASREEELSYPFTIARSLPSFTIWHEDPDSRIPQSSAGEFQQSAKIPDKACDYAEAELDLPPFRICLNQLQRFFGPHYQIGLTLLGPEHGLLERSLSSTEIRLEAFQLGEHRRVVLGQKAFPIMQWNSFEKVLSGQSYLSLELEAEIPLEDIRAIDGAIVLRFPEDTHTLGLEAGNPGIRSSVDDFSLTLKGYEAGSVLLEASGPRHRLLGFRVFDGNGQEIATRVNHIDDASGAEAPWGIQLATSGRPAKIEAILSRSDEELVFPFTIDR
ncbi:MAG: hypothetical protein R3245_00890, partial [Kiloniellales bacterium]|nr:hypothetical protein [Kiloniellales bacterium]